MVNHIFKLAIFSIFISSFAVNGQSGKAISLDGTNDYGSVTSGTAISGDFTVEAWVNPSSLTGDRCILSTLSGTGQSFSLMLSGTGIISVDLGTGLGWITTVADATGLSMATDTWQHIAVSVTAGTPGSFSIYLNGQLVATGVIMGTPLFSDGTRLVNIGFNPAGAEYFAGYIDDVRVWSTPLSGDDIRTNMCLEITASHANWGDLEYYYTLDDITGNVLGDASPNGNDGVVSGESSLIESGIPTGHVTSIMTTVIPGDEITLTHANGDNITARLTAGTALLMIVYLVNSSPNVTTPPVGLEKITDVNYFGVKLFGSVGGVYEVVYDYEGHPGITVESNLDLVSRANNAAPAWARHSLTPDEAANTLTLGGQTGTEFALGSSNGNALPITLLSFTAQKIDRKVELEWSTASEINSDFADLQLSYDSENWMSIATIEMKGNSQEVVHYNYTDNVGTEELVYYKIRFVYFDGSEEFSPIISTDMGELAEETSLFP